MVTIVVQKVMKLVEDVGRFFEFLGQILKKMFQKPFRLHLYANEIELLGVNSVPVILLSSLAIGMIFALQIVVLLQPFQSEIGVGAAVAVALAEELAPIITSLMLIAKNGSAMAAELGTMRVTEQIDALESMSIDPIHYLVVPRVIASILVFPVLTMLANVVGSFGSYFISTTLYRIDAASYIDFMFSVLTTRNIVIGLIKSVVMGFMVATISCFHGLHVSQGAKGVGEGATHAVVTSSVAILVADYLLATIMRLIFFG